MMKDEFSFRSGFNAEDIQFIADHVNVSEEDELGVSSEPILQFSSLRAFGD